MPCPHESLNLGLMKLSPSQIKARALVAAALADPELKDFGTGRYVFVPGLIGNAARGAQRAKAIRYEHLYLTAGRRGVWLRNPSVTCHATA